MDDLSVNLEDIVQWPPRGATHAAKGVSCVVVRNDYDRSRPSAESVRI